jgi:hypothetical protein
LTADDEADEVEAEAPVAEAEGKVVGVTYGMTFVPDKTPEKLTEAVLLRLVGLPRGGRETLDDVVDLADEVVAAGS